MIFLRGLFRKTGGIVQMRGEANRQRQERVRGVGKPARRKHRTAAHIGIPSAKYLQVSVHDTLGR